MDKTEYKILVISGGAVSGIDIAVRLTRAGFSTFLHASDFIEALGMIEKYKPNIMILDLHYFGFRCVDGTLSETKFATYVWNKYGIPNVYISPACEAVWKELKLHESRPLAIIERPFQDEVLINIINSSFFDSEGRVPAVARIRGLLTTEDKKRIRTAIKSARKSVSGEPLGRGK